MNSETWIKILWIALTGVIFTIVSFIISLALEYWNVKAPTQLEINCNYPDPEGTYETSNQSA